MAKVYIGVDPGISGALAVISEHGKFVAVHDMPTFKTGIKNQRQIDPIKLFAIFQKYPNIGGIVLEQVHAMPKQGVTSSFNFGVSFGIIKGIIGSLGIVPKLVGPRIWKKFFNLVSKPKDAARLKAISLFPVAPLSRKKDCDRADALLLTLYYIKNIT